MSLARDVASFGPQLGQAFLEPLAAPWRRVLEGIYLISPKVLEPCRRQFRISNRVANIPMPKIILNGARIVAIARELVSRTMPQHVRMNLKGQARLLTRPLHQPIEPIR